MHFRFLAGTFYSVMTALVLSMAISFAGVGPGFLVVFGFLLVIILPMVLGYHLSTGSPAVGNRPASQPHMTRRQAAITIGVVYAMLFVYLALPVMQAALYSAQPLTYRSMVQLALRNDLIMKMYFQPLDTGALAIIDQWRTKEISRVNLDFKKRLDALEAKRPDESDPIAYQAWFDSNIAVIDEKENRITKINTEARFKKIREINRVAGGKAESANTYNFILNMPGPLPFVVGLALIASIGGFLVSGFLPDKDKIRFRKVASWWAAVAVIAIVMTIIHQDRQHLMARESFISPELAPASRHEEPIPQFIAADRMPSYDQRWVKTGITIDKPTEVHIIGNGLRNGNMLSCGSEGCDTQQLPGERISDKAKYMAVIGRIGEGHLFLIGKGLEIDPDKFGAGELLVTVNQVVDDDAAWNNMNGGFSIRVVGARP